MEVDASVVQYPWEVGTTWVQDVRAVPLPAPKAKPLNDFLASVTFRIGGDFVVEEEFAFIIEGVLRGSIRQGAFLVKVETALAALVFVPYAALLAPIALEWFFGMLPFELVLGVARVRDRSVELHVSC